MSKHTRLLNRILQKNIQTRNESEANNVSRLSLIGGLNKSTETPIKESFISHRYQINKSVDETNTLTVLRRIRKRPIQQTLNGIIPLNLPADKTKHE